MTPIIVLLMLDQPPPEAAETAMRDHLKGWWSAWVTQRELPQDAYTDEPPVT